MFGRWLLAILALVLVFGGILGGRYHRGQQAAARAQQQVPAVSVATATAKPDTWQPRFRVVGTLAASQGTAITAQIAGNVTRVAFESGARVRKNDLLVQLDDSSQLAALHADQARLELARADHERLKKLFATHLVSEQQLQAAATTLGVAAAAVESDQATLRKLHIVAPFGGQLGIRRVSLGQYVSPGTSIVDLQDWDPLLLDFSIPQEQMRQVRPGADVGFAVDAWPGRIFPARVTAIGARVDPDTRNVSLQATLANPGGELRPGLYGHVELALSETTEGVSVPHTAIVYSTFGDTVYVVESSPAGAVARARVIQVKAERDDLVLVDRQGLKPGEVVVIAGQNKLRDGMPVVINNSLQP